MVAIEAALFAWSSSTRVDVRTVTTANILCSNGVIHIVDSVLVPE